MAKKSLPSPEKMRAVLSYDPETGALTFKRRPLEMFPNARLANAWNSRCAGKPACSTDRKGYKCGPVFGILMQAHRVAWVVHYGEWPKAGVDHINQNGSDNRLCNLREATQFENLRNIPKFSTNTSGYKGVSLDKRSGLWVARVSTGTNYQYLGMYATRERASEVYLAAAKEYHGEFFTTRLHRE